jgi:holin-like protein
VGIVAFLAVVRDDAVPIVGALLASWAIGLVVLGWTVTLLLPRRER